MRGCTRVRGARDGVGRDTRARTCERLQVHQRKPRRARRSPTPSRSRVVRLRYASLPWSLSLCSLLPCVPLAIDRYNWQIWQRVSASSFLLACHPSRPRASTSRIKPYSNAEYFVPHLRGRVRRLRYGTLLTRIGTESMHAHGISCPVRPQVELARPRRAAAPPPRGSRCPDTMT